jgi:hypothetical protein
MLYYSETAWSLPDITEVSDLFDLSYNRHEYELKIDKLAKNFRAKAQRRDPSELKAWNGAVRILQTGDHYLLVLVAMPSASHLLYTFNPFSRISLVKLSTFALVFVIALAILGYLWAKT